VEFLDKVKAAQLPTRTVPVSMRGDLVAEIEQLAPSGGLEDAARLREIAERIEALRATMAEHSHTFMLRALPGYKYRALKAEHPARLDDEGRVRTEDALLGANIDDLAEPLLRACVVDPQLDDATWRALEPVLTDRQYDDLVQAAIMVNQGPVSIPFSRAASRQMRNTEPE
jgi:hypothetical protein